MARPKSNGPYTPLAAMYFMDDAILEAGPDAEILFVRCLSFLASVTSNGFITDRQMKTVVGLGLRTVPHRLAKLQEVGLLEAVAGGFVVRSWQKWNKTPEEIGKSLARDRERKARDRAEKQTNSERNPDGIQSDSTDQSTAQHSSAVHSTVIVAERADVTELCSLLADLIEGNGSKRPTIGKTWLNDARLLIDADHRELASAKRLMRWCQSDTFWKANILSMSKFRDKYDQLRLAANRELAERKPTRTEQNLSTVAQYAQLEQIGIEA